MYEKVHKKTYNNTWATNEDTDQLARPRSLIRAFAGRMRPLLPANYSKGERQNV